MSFADPVRVLVVAVDSVTRAGLAALVSDIDGFSVVGQTPDDGDISAQVDLYRPDIIVWEIPEFPERMANLRDFDCPVVTIVSGDEAASFAWASGARGILPRSVGQSALAAALKAASEGLIAIDERLGAAIASSGGRQTQSHVEPLTRRELEILELVAAGMTNKAIASHVGISEHTVKFHVNALLGKLGAQSRTQAVTTATRMGLIRL